MDLDEDLGGGLGGDLDLEVARPPGPMLVEAEADCPGVDIS